MDERLIEAALPLVRCPGGAALPSREEGERALEWGWQQVLRHSGGRAERLVTGEELPNTLVFCLAELGGLFLRQLELGGASPVREAAGSWSRSVQAEEGGITRQTARVIRAWLGTEDGLLYRGAEVC